MGLVQATGKTTLIVSTQVDGCTQGVIDRYIMVRNILLAFEVRLQLAESARHW